MGVSEEAAVVKSRDRPKGRDPMGHRIPVAGREQANTKETEPLKETRCEAQWLVVRFNPDCLISPHVIARLAWGKTGNAILGSNQSGPESKPGSLVRLVGLLPFAFMT